MYPSGRTQFKMVAGTILLGAAIGAILALNAT